MRHLNLHVGAALAALAATTASASSSPDDVVVRLRGIPPSRHHLYTPEGPTWQCLNSTQTIPASAINDDYCDCDDGTDEPGTSACSGLPSSTLFWCKNQGHIEGWIRSGRVNDGVCDEECCDGSDEYDQGSGVKKCPDTCAKVGKEYRKRLQEEENIRSAGAKIRASYISETAKKLSSVRAEVATLEVEIEVAREAEKLRKADLERAEQMDKAVIEQKKKSPLYATLREHQDALRAMLQRDDDLKEELRRLTDLLDDLSDGYNPNYQDMAVKGAVMAYRSWRKGGDEGGDDDGGASGTEEAPPQEEDAAGDAATDGTTAPTVKSQENVKLRQLNDEGEFPRSKLRQIIDKETLELMDDEYFKGNVLDGTDQENILFRIHEYLPEPLVPFVDSIVDSLLDLLVKTNIVSGVKRSRRHTTGANANVAEPENVTAARKAHTDAAAHTRKVSSQLSTKRASLNDDPARFGRDAEWKALEGKCVEKDMGEYTYEYCFFGSTTQKPNKGGSNVSMGRFGAFEPLDSSLTPQDDAYFYRQKYVNGQRCWNGPDRSTIVDVVCGVDNALLEVFEAEKCIYSMKISTPAVCYPVEKADAATQQQQHKVKEEL